MRNMNVIMPVTDDVNKGIKTFGNTGKIKYGGERVGKFKLKDRTWVDNEISEAPTWCSSDLRDGNQALKSPMCVEKKIELFSILVELGFKEIEVGFPSASKPDYDFIRKLIDENLIPSDVKIQVLTQCREDLIEKTRECIEGAPNVILHLYNSTSKAQRDIVFKKSKEEIIELAEKGVDWTKEYFKDYKGNLTFQYSPESFTGTEIDFARDISEKVFERWDSFGGNDVIFNLPATVEVSSPIEYADKFEYIRRKFDTLIEETNSKVGAILSIHAHNDRGCAVSASEMAVQAGGKRIEGCLMGNGERTGNVDIIILALNLFTHGISPELDLREIYNRVRRVSDIIGMPIDPRHPYIGELAHTAFSGGHQDAIKKGLEDQKKREEDGFLEWIVPYLPIDPNDIGGIYEAIIQLNSQSGKGGVAYILEKAGYKIPKEMQKYPGSIIQEESERTGEDVSSERAKELFEDKYVNKEGKIKFNEFNYEEIRSLAKNNNTGPADELGKQISRKYGLEIDIKGFRADPTGEGSDAIAISYLVIEINGERYFGVGKDIAIGESSLVGVISTVNIALNGE